MSLRFLSTTSAFLMLASLGGTAFAQAQQAPAQAQQPVIPAAPTSAEDKAALNYALGYELGQRLSYLGESFDLATVQRGLQDAYTKKEPTQSSEKMSELYGGFEQRLQAKRAAEIDKAVTDNRAKAPEFLAKFKEIQGVVTLPSGVMYVIRENGTGAKPTANSKIELSYQARYAPIGLAFDEIRKTPQIGISDVPYVGLREVLPNVPAGSLVEVALPPGKAVTSGPGAQELAGQAVHLFVRVVTVQ